MPVQLQQLFGKNVRQLREKRGWTQEELANKAGLNRSYLGGIERGTRKIGIENIAKIALALEINAEILFREN